MASEPTTPSSSEPRALSAALAAPAFTTRTGGLAMHAASKHVERWAPETDAGQGRPMRSLGFVDRLVAPWIETAQRSAGLRMFSQYLGGGAGGNGGFAEREGSAVSWVFPRPWYQDELDWMAAARHVTRQPIAMGGGEQRRDAQPAMLTTRGTYVPPARAATSVPAALYEYVAPSLSVARGPMPLPGAEGGAPMRDAYSPLVPLAAVQAAQLVSRTMAQLSAPTVAPQFSTPTSRATAGAAPTMAPALRSVLATMLARAAAQPSSADAPTTRWASNAPALETPPAPRPERSGAETALVGDDGEASGGAAAFAPSAQRVAAERMATQLAEQRVRVVELQRAAHQAIARELATRTSTSAPSAGAPVAVAAAKIEEQRAQVEAAQQRAIAQREASQSDAQRTATTEAQRTQLEAARVEQQQLQAKIDERVAQRIAERASERPAAAPRLHEQARSEAARDARVAASAPATSAARVDAQEPRAAAAEAAVAALAAAMSGPLAALAPELAAIVGARPERAAQVIGELSEALRAAELMSRATASGHAFETTRGPRLTLPAGLGGLVATVDHAQALERPAPAPIGMTPAPRAPVAPTLAAPRLRDDLRVPTLGYIHGPAASPPASALAATAATSPHALQHVAWADRWLARFAGAQPASLDALGGATLTPQAMTLGIAGAAPGAVFVAPMFDAPAARGGAAAGATGAAPVDSTELAPMLRVDESQATPDDVFAAISATAAQARGAKGPSKFATRAFDAKELESKEPARLAPTERGSYADAIAHAVPVAPNAGMSAQLASSPFAPALRHVLPMPAAASFDVRALFGAALSATYLSGVFGDSSRELASAPSAMPWAPSLAAPPGETAAREVPAWDATYVAPELPAGAALAATDAFDASGDATIAPSDAAPIQARAAAAALPAMTTLRSALLAWDVELPATAATAQTTASASAPTMAAPAATTARSMIDAMAMPMLADAPAGAAESWSAPGMVADRAQSWSVAQERSSADLSFDFVTPELVLAARVYGLGPAEAAQASRLAIAGPGQLSAMAGMVDRTFVQAMAADAERRETARAISAYPVSSEAAPTARTRPAAASALAGVATSGTEPMSTPAASTGVAATAADIAPAMAAAMPSSGASFGVERRTPRGAFLWPSATVAALNLHAAAHDGQMSMSVAALELLAAQAVAEIGTYAAFASPRAQLADAGAVPDDATSADAASPIARTAAAALRAPELSSLAAPQLPPTAAMPARDSEAGMREPSEPDVLASATALVPAARRARFEAMYVALGQSHTTRSLSPAARAARALALAGRGDDAPTSTRERATAAWDVLPVVYAMGDAAPSTTIETGAAHARQSAAARGSSSVSAAASRGAAAAPGVNLGYAESGGISVDARPGLAALSARAGEALGSYVAPAPAPAPAPMPAASAPQSAAARAPTAAQELVRTGRPSGRFGGGEVEIPTWFENAARKMFEQQNGSSLSDGISLAELTLVNSAPSSHIAASTRSAPSAASPAPAASTGAPITPSFDVDKIAHEVYRQILVLMDNARARNGEPFL